MSVIKINKDKVNDFTKLAFSKKISFTDALSLITLTLAYFLLLSSGDTGEAWSVALLVYRLGFIPSIFVIKSMLSKSYKPIGYVFSDGWDIVKQSNLSDKEKIEILRTYLENRMERWFFYWIKFKTIVCSDKSWNKKWKQLIELIKEIVNGEMNHYQLAWLVIYYIYAILVATNILEIAGPYDLIINLIFLAIIYYATGDLIGLGNILVHIFTLLTGVQTEDDIRRNLIEIEKDLKTGSQIYYYYTADKSCIIEPKQGVKIRANGKPMTLEEIDREDIEEEIEALDKTIVLATEEKFKLKKALEQETEKKNN